MSETNRELPSGTQMAGEGSGDVWTQQLEMALVMHHLERARVLYPEDTIPIRARDLAFMANEIRRRRPQTFGDQIREAERRSRAAEVSAEAEKDHANRLAEIATKAIANVGHKTVDNGGKAMEATAIVVVANLLAEAIQRRQEAEDAVVLKGGTVSGSKAAIEYVKEAIAELMEWRAGEKRLTEDKAIKTQAEAWMAVFNTLYSRNKGAFTPGKSTMERAIEELERLYSIANELDKLRQALVDLGWVIERPPGK